MKVLILGSGGREDVVSSKLWEEGHEVIGAPGNPGMASRGPVVALDITKPEEVAEYVVRNGVEFTIVGGELPLSLGMVDYFNYHKLPIFGPTRAAARIETSKKFCHKLLSSAGVPVPSARFFEKFEDLAYAFRHGNKVYPLVLKYDGLAGGKGAYVTHDHGELTVALKQLSKFPDGPFIEQEFVDGPEMSFFILTDGWRVRFLGSAQDYKPLYDGGPNTGGMGGVAPHPLLRESPDLFDTIMETIVKPTVKALRDGNCRYRGVLYFGLKLTEQGPAVLEINARFGDPEAQLLVPLFDFDLLPLLLSSAGVGIYEHYLELFNIVFKPGVAVGITLASEGYPDKPIVGREIPGFSGNWAQGQNGLHVFHAGTSISSGKLVTAGGRVLTVVARDMTYEEARKRALSLANNIEFEGRYYRQDIAEGV